MKFRKTYLQKKEILDIIHSADNSEVKIKKFSKWIKRNHESDLPKLKECAKNYQHWYVDIKNSLQVPYSNGAAKGFNNKIKVLKRVCFRIRNFSYSKARIMLLNRS